MNILLTGSTGFVGTALARRLGERPDWQLRLAARHSSPGRQPYGQTIHIGDLSASTPLENATQGIDVVIHAAARVHVMRDTAAAPLAAFRQVNVEGTLNLAHHAVRAGVKRFVFISSVKVHGDTSAPHCPLTETSPANPSDAYGQSKVEAERGLRDIANQSGMPVVIIRPPLVYGAGVGANFHALMTAIRRGVPLPLGAVRNQRSLVALDNLVDLVVRCVDHPAAANETFLVSDGEDLSTPELIERLAQAMNRPARILRVPVGLLFAVAALAGRRGAMERLCGSLQVDATKARSFLGWTPPVSVDEGLRLCVAGFQTP